ncbi:ParB/RepB/Spo0J family partition protein [Ruminococcus sp.]|uniref:ParB/RepB/Spo0J family partition protein n=2 Tax=Ruminococcus sp. TaxID=41978 RepID=UPI002BACD0EF|nr:ParB/RepB/Spo0J family partition protein [Ruminococcus sp.]HOA00025.1 ParB/RepB/Spo0J family partition protein [Ruminococcus sp.]
MKGSMLGNLSAIVSDTLTDSIKMIDIAELHESADNFFVLENIESFAQIILGQGGVKDNLIVRPLETGGYEIISGHRRRAAVQWLIDNRENISRFLPCLVQNYTDEDDKMLDLILMNVSARQLSDPELWKSYETIDKILKEKKAKGEYFGRIRDDIAKHLGVSSAQVGKMQNIEKNAIEPVKEAIASGDLSISTANEIAKLDKVEQSNIRDLSKVQPKDIKKKSVDTNINEDDDVDTSHNDDISINNDPTVLSPEEEMAIERSLVSQKEVSLSKWAQSLKQEQLQYLLDNGMYNSAIKGYVMLAAEEASFSKEQINALLGGIMKALKNYDKAAAENKFLLR